MRTIQKWLERKDTTLRQEREKKIFAMWLACYTQEEIAEAVRLTDGEVGKVLKPLQNAELPNGDILAANHSDLDPLPIYNVLISSTPIFTGTLNGIVIPQIRKGQPRNCFFRFPP